MQVNLLKMIQKTPLIRKFSKSYNEYYEKLIKANEVYLKYKS